MPALPRFIQIEPVGECNLRCRMCPVQFRRDGRPYGPPAFIDVELFISILDQFPDLRELQLQGLGEPLMHPRFFEMVEIAASRGIDVAVNTNLSFMTERNAEACVTSGLARLHASLDGATPETYERIRVRGNYAKAVRNLQRVLAARRRLRSRTPLVELVAVAMRENIHELPALIVSAARSGVDRVSVQHLCHDFAESSLPESYRPMRQFVEEQTLVNESPERVARIFEETKRAAELHKLDLRLPRIASEPSQQPRGCTWPTTGAYFSYAGDVMPCCMISTPDRFTFGDVRKQPFAQMWNGERYETFRADLASPNPPEICRSCAVYTGTF